MGNGVCDDVFDGNALVPFTHGMGLIPDELYEVCGSISLLCIIFFFWIHSLACRFSFMFTLVLL